MEERINLHMHSTSSDGTDSFKSLLKICNSMNMTSFET